MKLDLLLRNADIITMDERRPHATSLGVWQGRIVGLDDDLAGLDAAEVLDLGGATVTPGFIDAHCHTTWFGLGLGELDVSAARGLTQLYALLEAGMAADSARPEAGQEPGTGAAPDWLLATGFSQQQHGGEFPDITVLDRITGNRPLFMRHNSGHMAVVNRAALRLAGAEPASFPDPDGGVIVRDAAGRPTGLVQETAQQLIQQLILPYSSEAIEAALDRATRHYATEGITSFTEAGIGGGWIGHSPVELAAYQRAAENGRLHARAQLMTVLEVLRPLAGHDQDSPGAAPAGLDLGIATGFGGEFLSLGPAKVFLDGSLLGETAAVSQEFCSHSHKDNAGNVGYFQADPLQLRAEIEAAYAAGWSIAAHAIGDRAVDLAIDIIAGCERRFGRRAVPNRIEHASMTRPDQLEKLAAAGIAVTPQASFFHEGGDGMTASLGPERIGWAYRASSFLAAGVTLAGSSDRPVADGNVLRGMQAFVDRRTSSGALFGNPSECLTPRQALAAYTTGAAAATGAAQLKGSLEPGKLADFTVLSGSPLTAERIDGLEVLATAVGGHFTHLALPGQRSRQRSGPLSGGAAAVRLR